MALAARMAYFLVLLCMFTNSIFGDSSSNFVRRSSYLIVFVDVLNSEEILERATTPVLAKFIVRNLLRSQLTESGLKSR